MEGFQGNTPERKKEPPKKRGGAQGFTRAMLLATLAAINAPDKTDAKEFPKGLNSMVRTIGESVHKKVRTDATDWTAFSSDLDTALKQDEHYDLIKRMRGDYVQGGEIEKPVEGFNKFCEELAHFCREFADTNPNREEHSMRLTPELHSRIKKIHQMVNTKIIPKTDLLMHGVPEKWTIPLEAGDCEDFALLKMLLLIIKEKVDPAYLHIMVVKQKNGEGHAVLGVDVFENETRNTLVLDNLKPDIMTLAEMEKEYTGSLASFVHQEPSSGQMRVGFFPYELKGKE